MEKTSEKGWKRLSSFQRLLIVFSILIVLGGVATGLYIYVISERYFTNQSRERVKGAKEIITEMSQDTLGDMDLFDSKNSKVVIERLEDSMSKICESMNMQYMYLYYIDPAKDKERCYILTVAKDVQDRKVEKDFSGYNTRVSIPFSKQEKDAINGIFGDKPYVIDNEYGNDYSWVAPLWHKGNLHLVLGVDFKVNVLAGEVYKFVIAVMVPGIVLLILIVLIALIFVKKLATDPLQMLTEEQAEQRMLANITQQIQKGILPETYSVLKEKYEAFGYAESAKNVGGDFYDCFQRSDGRVCCVMGDVSGKGIAAALFMAVVKTMVREHLMMGESPSQVLNYVNDEICKSNPQGMFATVFVVVFEPDTGKCTYANAGHTHPLVVGNGKAKYIVPDPGLAIGLFPDAGIIDEELQIENGQGILLYTDGVVEAVNKDKQFYGEEKLEQLLETNESKSIENIVNAVVEDVMLFQKECEPFDDITILGLKRKS